MQLAPLLALGFVLGGLPRALGAGARIQEILDAEVSAGAGASAGPPDATQPGSNPPRIEVRDLSCRLDGSDEPALSGVSFTVEPGQTLGICGPVGSGKSTLVDLLLRLEDPEPGRIFVDGEDLLTIAPDVLRARTAVALQDPFLLRDTVAANASFGGTTNDEDVNVLEVEHLIDSLKAAGKKFEYKIYEDAPGGHYFDRIDTPLAKEARQKAWAFLAKHLK